MHLYSKVNSIQFIIRTYYQVIMYEIVALENIPYLNAELYNFSHNQDPRQGEKTFKNNKFN